MVLPPVVDCHNHLIDPTRFPFAPTGGYRPRPDETGTHEAFASILRAHGVRHALLVQPSCYGTDNQAIQDALAHHPDIFKAIGVFDQAISEKELEALEAAGFLGVRFNLPFDPSALVRPGAEDFLARITARRWFVEIHGRDADWVAAAPILRRSRVRLLVDHMGLDAGTLAGPHGGFAAVLALASDMDATVKLSAPFRASRRSPFYDDLDPLIQAVLDAFGIARCVWGSDWPFLDTMPRPTYDEAMAPLARWIPDPAHCRAVLWDNPRRLFGFAGKDEG